MSEINTFKELDKLVMVSRNSFHKNINQSQLEFEEIFFHCFNLFKSIIKFYKPEEWHDRRQEFVLGVLIQSLETILAMYYLTESGFWDNSLVLKRNYVELLCVAIAIGYDNQCYSEWKNNNENFRTFGKLMKRIKNNGNIPDLEKKSILPLLQKYWNESSQSYSHNLGIQSIRTLERNGQIKFEPKTAEADFQQKRLRTFRNMLLNIDSVTMGVFDYGVVAESRKKEFPEALNLISQFNAFIHNDDWKKQETI